VDLAAWTNDAVEWMRQAPPAPALLALFAASFLEYVAPPVPGDTLILAGGVFAAQGIFPLPLLLATTTTGSVAGSIAAWAIGRWSTRSARLHRLFTRFVSAERLARAQAAYQKRGRWFVLANRFFPGVRATFLFVAGYAHVPLREIVVYGSLSALAWNTVLVGAGYAVGLNLDALFVLARAYTTVAWIVVAALAAAFVGRLLWKRARKR
jgi:membrane protein DedA with SNARE-associated domain